MKIFLIAGAKGGIGKTTVATNMAAYLALRNHKVIVADADPQQSATQWTRRRADLSTAVHAINVSRRQLLPTVSQDIDYVIVDAPAGAQATQLARFLELADAVVVPLAPSALDIDAIVGFLNTLAKIPRVHRRRLPVGIVLNRARPRTQLTQQARAMLKQWPYPLLTTLRDSQAYVILSGLGRSLFDYHSAQVIEHQRDWKPLMRWLSKC